MTGWRDDAVEAGARALLLTACRCPIHGPYGSPCPIHGTDRDRAAAVVDAVAERIRADERSRSQGIIDELENHLDNLPRHIAEAIEAEQDRDPVTGEVESSEKNEVLAWAARRTRRFGGSE